MQVSGVAILSLQFLIHASSSICIYFVWCICMMPDTFLMCVASASERVLAEPFWKAPRSPERSSRCWHLSGSGSLWWPQSADALQAQDIRYLAALKHKVITPTTRCVCRCVREEDILERARERGSERVLVNACVFVWVIKSACAIVWFDSLSNSSHATPSNCRARARTSKGSHWFMSQWQESYCSSSGFPEFELSE